MDNREIEFLRNAKSSFPVDVKGLTLKLGIKYELMFLDDNQSGLIKKELDGTYTIGINMFDGDQRQRFTCAHELGHYFLHRDLLEPGGSHFDRLYNGHNESGVLTTRHEAQANRFAAETLMPEDSIRDCFNVGNCDVKDLARKFGVSPVAMKWRLVNLRLKTKSELGL